MWPFTRSTKDSGRWGEDLAGHHLKAKGMQILGMRVRVGARDEMDVIARDGHCLVFVEVKTRRTEDFGRGFSAINSKKRFHLSRAAVRYLKRSGLESPYFRFDVVEVVGTPGDARPEIIHTEAAFNLHRSFEWPA